LPRDVLRAVKGLEGLSVFHGWQQATNFPVTHAEGEILIGLVESGGVHVGGVQRQGGSPQSPIYQDAVQRAFRQIEGKDTVIEFFVVFSRFEYALLRAGYISGDCHGVLANWDRFASEANQRFNPDATAALKRSTSYLLTHPPRKQVNEEGHLAWSDGFPVVNQPRLLRLSLLVRRIRNNLFHGEKLNDLLEGYSSRNLELIGSALTVLYACVDLNDTVRDFFRQGLW
jgi:hypothetical protein